MIKCNVTICGTISRDASVRTGKDGKEFVSFPLQVSIPGKNGYNPQIQISAESETKRSIFREKDKTKRSKRKARNTQKAETKVL